MQMNLYAIVAMAALGLGGGLAGLAWGWRESVREAYAARLWAGHSSFMLVGGRPVSIAGPVELNLVPTSSEVVRISGGSGASNGTYLVQARPS